MRGLFLDHGTALVRDDLPEPERAPTTTIVRVLRAGVCATDVALARGYMRFRGVPGHEFVGVALDGPLAGQRVVGEINAGCGTCPRCRSGDPRHCANRTVLGILAHPGAFAERIALPTRNLLPVPASVSTDAATFTEPIAAALQIGEQLALERFRRALVAGDGKLGLLCATVLACAGVDVTVAGRHRERAALLPHTVRFATGTLEHSADPDAAPAFDLAVEATGRPDVLARVLRLVTPGGTVVLKTTTESPVTLDASRIVVDEITLVGSRCGRFAPALASLADRSIDPEPLIAARYPLAEAAQALAHAARPGVLKVLVDVAAE